jgi:hypothetical protein
LIFSNFSDIYTAHQQTTTWIFVKILRDIYSPSTNHDLFQN